MFMYFQSNIKTDSVGGVKECIHLVSIERSAISTKPIVLIKQAD